MALTSNLKHTGAAGAAVLREQREYVMEVAGWGSRSNRTPKERMEQKRREFCKIVVTIWALRWRRKFDPYPVYVLLEKAHALRAEIESEERQGK